MSNTEYLESGTFRSVLELLLSKFISVTVGEVKPNEYTSELTYQTATLVLEGGTIEIFVSCDVSEPNTERIRIDFLPKEKLRTTPFAMLEQPEPDEPSWDVWTEEELNQHYLWLGAHMDEVDDDTKSGAEE